MDQNWTPGNSPAVPPPHLGGPPPTNSHYLDPLTGSPPPAHQGNPHWTGALRHPGEIPLLVVAIFISILAYAVAIILLIGGALPTWSLILLVAPILIYLGRGQLYAQARVSGVKITPTQFPEAHQLVLDAAWRFGMPRPPDAYVVLGNGQINAYASGHGFRRFVVVYSDLFEVGGAARQPAALAFIIGHEVGHIAAGHVSYWRQLGMFAANYVPFVGSALSRSMEYTADNHGYLYRPEGRFGMIGVLSAGKYLVSSVGFDELADRATHEQGFFVWLANLLANHPVNTWRAAALRNRTRSGHLFFRPKQLYREYGPPPLGYLQPPDLTAPKSAY